MSISGIFNEGDYKLTITPSKIEAIAVGTNLKYRVVVRKPKGDVLVYSGTYPNVTSTSPARTVLTFSKTGLGAFADYNNFVFTP